MKHIVKYVLKNDGTDAAGNGVVYPNRATASTGDDLNSNRGIDDNYNPEIRYGVAVVELQKKDRSNLGVIIAGGEDKGSRARISNLRPGGLAYRSDALCIGDHIVSVNGIRTAKLKHDEIINLLKNADGHVTLEVEYELPFSPTENLPCVCPKAIQVRLEKENGSFGFVLRGGVAFDCPLTVTYVRPGGPADRDGTIKAGDRLLAVDNFNLFTVTQSEAANILKQIKYEGVFTVEYDVSVMEAVRNASGPLLVEIERGSGGNQQFGVALATSFKEPASILIHSIKQASLAERCGALHVGDRVLAIDGVTLEGTTAAEASQLLKNSCGDRIRLEILPLSQMLCGSRLPEVSVRRGMSATSSFATLGSVYRHLRPYVRANEWRPHRSMEPSPSSSSLPSCVSSCSASLLSPTAAALPPPLCRPEITDVTLCAADQRGFGFSLQSAPPSTLLAPPVIASLDPGGPAERSGVMQVGDRILSVNGISVEGRSVEDVSQMLLLSKPRVNIRIEFDVAESVVPSSGVFDVRLPCKGTATLGITITGPRDHSFGDVPSISDVRRGGVAHRTGTIHVGDQLLAIGSIHTDQYCLEDAIQFLKECRDDVIRLRIRKGDLQSVIASSAIAVTTRIAEKGVIYRDSISSSSGGASAAGVGARGAERDIHHADEEAGNDWIVYSVEMVRRGCGPLGITVAGSEEPFRPIIVSALTSGGLAQQTGALHVGDRLLAVNGTSLHDKPLGSVIQLLQNSGDVVTIKVARSVGEMSESYYGHEESSTKDVGGSSGGGGNGGGGATPLPSIDSAVESWDEGIAAFDGLYTSSGSNGHHGGLTVMLRNPQQRRDSERRSPLSLNGDLDAAREIDEEDQTQLDEAASNRPQASNGSRNYDSNQEWSQSVCNKKRELQNTQEEEEEEGEDEETLKEGEEEVASERTDISQLPEVVTATSSSRLLVVDERQSMRRRVSDEALCPRQSFTDDTSCVPTMAQASGEGLHVNTLPHGARNSRRRHVKGDSSDIISSNRVLGGISGADGESGEEVPYPIEVHRVILFKDTIYDDFGFSVSDGLHERGVYVNRIRPGGPAEIGGILRSFDRILQVNDTKTHDFDCCLTVPLIAAAGDRIRIVIVRNPYTGMSIPRPFYGGGSSSEAGASRWAGGSAIGMVCGGPLPWMDEESRDLVMAAGSSTNGDAGDSITKSL